MSRGISGFIALLLATLAFAIKPVSLAEAQNQEAPIMAPSLPPGAEQISGGVGGQAIPLPSGSGHVTRVSVPGTEELAAPPRTVSTDNGAKGMRLVTKWKGQRGDHEVVTEAGASEAPKDVVKRHLDAVVEFQRADPPSGS